MEPLILLVVVLLLVALAWKILSGVVRTVALIAILGAAALFVFGSMG